MALIRQRRRTPSSNQDSQIRQRGVEPLHQVARFRWRTWRKIGKAHHGHALFSHQRHQLGRQQPRARDLDRDRQIVHRLREHRQGELVGGAVRRVAQHAQWFTGDRPTSLT
jgi:hypothetical protein